jgi:hypothetical protein
MISLLERLKLNTDSKITTRNGLKYGEWKDQIQNDFKLNGHRLAYSYMCDDLIGYIKNGNKHNAGSWQQIRFEHLDPLPEYIEECCKDILNKDVSLWDKLYTLYKDFPYGNSTDTTNIYYLYYDHKHFVLIVNFKDLLKGEKQYDAYELYEKTR